MCPGYEPIDFWMLNPSSPEAWKASVYNVGIRVYWKPELTRIIVNQMLRFPAMPMSDAGIPAGQAPRKAFCIVRTEQAPGPGWLPHEMLTALTRGNTRIWVDGRAAWPVSGNSFSVSVYDPRYKADPNDETWLPAFGSYGAYLDPDTALGVAGEFLRSLRSKCEEQGMTWYEGTRECVAKSDTAPPPNGGQQTAIAPVEEKTWWQKRSDAEKMAIVFGSLGIVAFVAFKTATPQPGRKSYVANRRRARRGRK